MRSDKHARDEEKKPPVPEFLYPAVYYYPGTAGTLGHFGHVSIALNETTYLTFGETIRARKTIAEGVAQEMVIYDCTPFVILLPPLPEGARTAARIRAFEAEWEIRFPPGEYSLLTRNCAHSVLDCLDRLGYRLPETYLTSFLPSTMAYRACTIQLAYLEREAEKVGSASNINPKKKLEVLLGNQILQLQTRIIRESTGIFSAAEQAFLPNQRRKSSIFQGWTTRRGSVSKGEASLEPKDMAPSSAQHELELLISLRDFMQKKDPVSFWHNMEKFARESGYAFLNQCLSIYQLEDAQNPRVEEKYQRSKINAMDIEIHTAHRDLADNLADFLDKQKKSISELAPETLFSSLCKLSQSCGKAVRDRIDHVVGDMAREELAAFLAPSAARETKSPDTSANQAQAMKQDYEDFRQEYQDSRQEYQDFKHMVDKLVIALGAMQRMSPRGNFKGTIQSAFVRTVTEFVVDPGKKSLSKDLLEHLKTNLQTGLDAAVGDDTVKPGDRKLLQEIIDDLSAEKTPDLPLEAKPGMNLSPTA